VQILLAKPQWQGDHAHAGAAPARELAAALR
jgi:hypothetical protein